MECDRIVSRLVVNWKWVNQHWLWLGIIANSHCLCSKVVDQPPQWPQCGTWSSNHTLQYLINNQVLDYKDSRVMPRLVIPRLENVDKMPKLNPRISLGISSDLRIAIPRFNPSS